MRDRKTQEGQKDTGGTQRGLKDTGGTQRPRMDTKTQEGEITHRYFRRIKGELTGLKDFIRGEEAGETQNIESNSPPRCYWHLRCCFSHHNHHLYYLQDPNISPSVSRHITFRISWLIKLRYGNWNSNWHITIGRKISVPVLPQLDSVTGLFTTSLKMWVTTVNQSSTPGIDLFVGLILDKCLLRDQIERQGLFVQSV